jgi:hypothetical protein
MLVVVLNLNFAEVKVSMHQTGIVSRIESSCHLNRGIKDQLTELPGHIHRQIKLQRPDVVKHRSAVLKFSYGEPKPRFLIIKAFKRGANVRVSIHVNPLVNVFALSNLLQSELLSEVLVESGKACLGQDARDLKYLSSRLLPLTCRCGGAARCTE